ncbi:glycoside hydrolase family 127 protein [Evansella sp. AB-P1]|uniref:glycoside hydrolase family 127 protein n=1 Tax=Evansella sp. AB-P1 TaxID=3037653 RepID=UPI00241DDE56|nr:beta-L-arabinofuranosidase domain-containing protein [Evansella sp. AB-P1]MDG5786221.1 glycoside hydrolase family 127 protein [Evansella sp. AB-P1]
MKGHAKDIKPKVTVNDRFWKRKIEVVQKEVIPYQWKALNDQLSDAKPSHAIRNFKIAAGEEEGEFYGKVFQDSDVAKWLEAVAYSLETLPNPDLETIADEVIDLIGRAQQNDGYLNTYYTIKEPNKRWTNLRDNHELYVSGHLIEAAVAYYEATGKKKFLNIMCKNADYITSVFGPHKHQIQGYPGHQEIELALIKLYRITNKDAYLQLSKFFIEQRGKEPHYFKLEAKKRNDDRPFRGELKYKYNQSHTPVFNQTEAVGHAVRGVYMYTAIAELASITGDNTFIETAKKLWNNVTKKQMYLTGGIGASPFGEAFSTDYDLPNDTCYNETCASIGLVFWANRMLQMEKKAEYADVLERVIYNGTISGMDLKGNKFFYVNPLEVTPEVIENRHDHKHVKPERQTWFKTACCPPNLARMVTSIGKHIYSVEDQQLFIHLYMGNEGEFIINGTPVSIVQKTTYPWEATVEIEVSPAQPNDFTLALRIPGWCQHATITIQGEVFNIADNLKDGYVYIRRNWKENDLIQLHFQMEVQRIRSNPKVRENVGKVALQRGPIVYCIEECDNGSDLHGIALPSDAKLSATYDENLLNGVVYISGEGKRISETSEKEELYSTIPMTTNKVELKAIPYYAWCNRKPGEMRVWINNQLQ